jgi:hypothetical protein
VQIPIRRGNYYSLQEFSPNLYCLPHDHHMLLTMKGGSHVENETSVKKCVANYKIMSTTPLICNCVYTIIHLDNQPKYVLWLNVNRVIIQKKVNKVIKTSICADFRVINISLIYVII